MIPNRQTVARMGLLLIGGTIQAATFINTCPFVITSPGDYLLAADLICGGGVGIGITSSDVTLKLEGHRITAGEGAMLAIEVRNPLPMSMTPRVIQNVPILGPGLITNGGGNTFGAGVWLGSVQNSEVSGITVLASAQGIFVAECSGLTITANIFGRNGMGIYLVDSTSNTISGNDASGNGTGIFVDFGEAPRPTRTVSHNVLNGNTTAGLVIADQASPVTVQNNVIDGNGQYGIVVSETSMPGTEVTNNTSLANRNFDMFDGSAVCSGHVWSGNTFFTANQSCIH
jgi:parallel beta-helix repeat protein